MSDTAASSKRRKSWAVRSFLCFNPSEDMLDDAAAMGSGFVKLKSPVFADEPALVEPPRQPRRNTGKLEIREFAPRLCSS